MNDVSNKTVMYTVGLWGCTIVSFLSEGWIDWLALFGALMFVALTWIEYKAEQNKSKGDDVEATEKRNG